MKEVITDCQCECSNCGEVIQYRSGQAGEVVKCPRCGEQSRLPEAQKLLMLEPAGPQPPQSRNCDACGTQLGFFDADCPTCERSRKQKVLLKRVLIGASAVIVLAGGGFLLKQWTKPKSVAARAPASHIMIAQAVPRPAASTNDLQPRGFVLERQHGETIGTAVGDILNDSENVHHRVKAEVDLLDKKGVKIGTVSDYFVDLGAHQTWHFVAAVNDPNVMSVRFAGFKQDELP